jgi:hypothetical protein
VGWGLAEDALEVWGGGLELWAPGVGALCKPHCPLVAEITRNRLGTWSGLQSQPVGQCSGAGRGLRVGVGVRMVN